MSIYKEKSGFVYIWYDRKFKRYYIGCHWGFEDDGYICSSSWMKKSYKNRPEDFKRRILKSNILYRPDMYIEEQRWLDMIKQTEIKPFNNNPRYYNLCLSVGDLWHKYDEKVKTIGEKISISKTGKNTGPRDPSVGENISKSKKEKFAKKQEELGYKFSPEHCEKLAEGRKDKPHTEEWKADQSTRLKEQWDNGTRKRAQPKKKMTKEEQAVVSSESLKSKWSDPEWKERQREALREGAKSRPPRSEESKQKARLAQLGKPKKRKNKEAA